MFKEAKGNSYLLCSFLSKSFVFCSHQEPVKINILLPKPEIITLLFLLELQDHWRHLYFGR